MNELQIGIDSKRFGDRAVLEGLNLTFTLPGLYLLTGDNGAGKSTLLSIIAGRDKDYTGDITVDGKVLDRKDYDTYFERWVTFVPQNAIVFSDLTVLDNIFVPYDTKDKARAHEILRRFHLDDLAESTANNLSAGEKERLAFARAVYSPNPIILLDEITANLDPESAAVLEENIVSLSRDHLVIFVTHEDTKLRDDPAVGLIELDRGRISSLRNPERGEPVDTEVAVSTDGGSGTHSFGWRSHRGGFITIAVAFIALFLLGIFSGAYGETSTSDHLQSLALQDYVSNAPAILISEPDIERENGKNSDVAEYLVYPDYSADTSDLLNSAGNNIGLSSSSLTTSGRITGIVVADNDLLTDVTSSIIAGSMPSGPYEICISDISAELIEEALIERGLASNSESALSMLLSDVRLPARGIGDAFSISGIYSSSDSSEFSARLGCLSSVDSCSLEMRCSFGFMIETAFTVFGGDEDSYGELLSTRTVMSEELDSSSIEVSMLQANVQYCVRTGTPSGLLLLETDGSSLEDEFSYSNSWYMLEGITLGMAAVIAVVVPVALYFRDRRRLILMRNVGASRARLIRDQLVSYGLVAGISAVLGIVLGVLAIAIAGASVQSSLIGSLSGIFVYDVFSFVSSIAIALISFAVQAILLVFMTLPKDDSKLLYEIRNK